MDADISPRPVRNFVPTDRPAVIASLPCPACVDSLRSDCERCAGAGVELWRVHPERAAWDAQRLREHYDA